MEQAQAEKIRRLWKKLVATELDLLETTQPAAYGRIPLFLGTDPENINGWSYSACFYGILNNRNADESDAMSTTIRDSLAESWKVERQITPIEKLTLIFYGPFCDHREVTDIGLTREVFKGWIQAHYRKSLSSVNVP